MEIAHETGTHAVIKSPHLDRLTPRVSRLGFTLVVFHRTTATNEIKKKIIKNTNINQSQYQYWKMCKKVRSV